MYKIAQKFFIEHRLDIRQFLDKVQNGLARHYFLHNDESPRAFSPGINEIAEEAKLVLQEKFPRKICHDAQAFVVARNALEELVKELCERHSILEEDLANGIPISQSLYLLPITILKLKLLRKAGFNEVWLLENGDDKQIIKVEGIGKQTLKQIRAALGQYQSRTNRSP